MQKVSLAQESFDECNDQSNKSLAMTIICINRQTKMEDNVTNSTLICFDCKYFLLKKV